MRARRNKTIPIDYSDKQKIVGWFLQYLDAHGIQDIEITSVAGLGVNAISGWRAGAEPTLSNLERALNVIGYTIPLPVSKNRNLHAAGDKNR